MKLEFMACLGVVLAVAGCRSDMHDQPKFEALEANTFFADGRAARPHIASTVARGELFADEHLYTGWIDGELAPTYPIEITAGTLARGRQRFDIYCAPCHGRLGDGNGMVAIRGFRHPPSYHSERLRTAAPGHFFDVITNGFGSMTDFSDRIRAEDRWAITAYIEALQLAQHALLEDLSAEDLMRLRKGK